MAYDIFVWFFPKIVACLILNLFKNNSFIKLKLFYSVVSLRYRIWTIFEVFALLCKLPILNANQRVIHLALCTCICYRLDATIPEVHKQLLVARHSWRISFVSSPIPSSSFSYFLLLFWDRVSLCNTAWNSLYSSRWPQTPTILLARHPRCWGDRCVFLRRH
jgi:hypothetical protein